MEEFLKCVGLAKSTEPGVNDGMNAASVKSSIRRLNPFSNQIYYRKMRFKRKPKYLSLPISMVATSTQLLHEPLPQYLSQIVQTNYERYCNRSIPVIQPVGRNPKRRALQENRQIANSKELRLETRKPVLSTVKPCKVRLNRVSTECLQESQKTLSLKGVESSSCASSPESLLVDSSSETYLSCLTASSNFKLIGNTPLEDMLTKPNSTKTKLEIANTFASPKVIKPMTKSQDCEEQIEIIDLTLDDDEEESELVMSTSYTKRAWLHSSTVLGSI